MSNETEPVKIGDVKFRLSSWAFHEQNPWNDGSEEGRELLASMQQRDLDLGIQALKTFIEAGPVWLTIGAEATLETHDPIAAQESVQDADLASAQARFYDRTVSMLPKSSLAFDTVAQFVAPGEETPHTYFGNEAAKRFIIVDDIARALLDGSVIGFHPARL